MQNCEQQLKWTFRTMDNSCTGHVELWTTAVNSCAEYAKLWTTAVVYMYTV